MNAKEMATIICTEVCDEKCTRQPELVGTCSSYLLMQRGFLAALRHGEAPTFTGLTDHNQQQLNLLDTVRWMACCGDCFQGVIDFRQNKDERIPFISGFLVTKVRNITDEVTDEDGNLLGSWNGELEVIAQNA